MSESQQARTGAVRSASTIAEFLPALRSAYRDRPAVALDGHEVTYGDLDRHSSERARALLGSGVGKGTRIGLLVGNSPEWVIWWAAICRVGAVAVPLSTFGRPAELARTIRHGDLHGIVAQRSHLGRDLTTELIKAFPVLAEQQTPHLVVPSAPFLRWILVEGDDTPAWALSEAHLAQRILPTEVLESAQQEVHVDDVALIIYTSGSSAEPKGVMHTHGAVMKKVHYLRAMLEVRDGASRHALMPFFWVGGLVMQLLTVLEAGGRVECHTASRYRAAPLGSTVKSADPFHHLRLSPALGMTETFGMYSWGRTYRADGHELASPLDEFEPGYEVEVVDGDANPVADGEEGEIIVRGPTVTRQLVKVDRADVFESDGFFHTGDRALREGGRLHFVGRMGDMIKTSGANVAPPEVERELASLPGVEAAFVTGVDEPSRGQEVVAAIVWSADAPFDAEELRRALRERLSPYKIPRRLVEIPMEEVPMTPSQKVNRRALGDLILRASAGDPAAAAIGGN